MKLEDPSTVYNQVYKKLIKDNSDAQIEDYDTLVKLLYSDPKYVTFGSPLGLTKDKRIVAHSITEAIAGPLGKYCMTFMFIFSTV